MLISSTDTLHGLIAAGWRHPFQPLVVMSLVVTAGPMKGKRSGPECPTTVDVSQWHLAMNEQSE